MPVDLPPPIDIAAAALPAGPAPDAPAPDLPVYGPVDTEEVTRSTRSEGQRGCPQSTENVIVVCSWADSEQYRYKPANVRVPTAMEELGQALTLRLGPVEIRPSGLGIGMRVRF